jgi:hypothetical protein
MAKKKKSTKKKPAAKAKKPAAKKITKSKSAAPSKKPARPKKKPVKKSPSPKKRVVSLRGASSGPNEALPMVKGPGARTGGQSGDLEGLSDVESADSESVEELAEEGQDFEAEIVDAVQNAPDPDEGELTTEVPEDDHDSENGSFSRRNRL